MSVTVFLKDGRCPTFQNADGAEFDDSRTSDGNLKVKASYRIVAEFKREEVIGFSIEEGALA